MRMRRVPVIECCLLLAAGLLPAAERTICVPGEERRWVCGDEASLRNRPVEPPAPPPAAPLPPVLLIDPDRLFGPAPKPEVRAASTAEDRDRPANTTAAAVTTSPAAPEPAAAPAVVPRRGSHVWQLVRASSPIGFTAFLKSRGLDAAATRALQTRRGDWLLLYGDFPDIDAARAARSQAGAGFARRWSDIEAEL